MSVVLRGIAPILIRVMLLIAILLLVRGHNHPGGGFIGALVACCAIGLAILVQTYEKMFPYFNATVVVGLGVLCLSLAATIPILLNMSLLEGIWYVDNLMQQKLAIGTPLLFDLGIFLCVLGSISRIIEDVEL